jgi:hypothetical protein
VASFDLLALFIAALDSIPLAALALASATLLHRLSEGEQHPQAAMEDPKGAMEDPQAVWQAEIEAKLSDLASKMDAQFTTSEMENTCPHCGTELPNRQSVASAVRHGHCRHCKPVETNGNGNGHQQETIEGMEVMA